MRNYVPFFVLLHFFCLTGTCQKKEVSGCIVNSIDKKCIPFSSIRIIGTNSFFDADDKGVFKIIASKTDNLIFSCIGYNSIIKNVNELSKLDTIYLTEKIFTLDSVSVRNTQLKQIGILEAKQTRSFAGETVSDNYEMATKIEIPADIKLYRVTKLLFKQKKFSHDRPLRVHIYKCNSDGMPGEEILKNQVIISENDNRNGILEIDVKRQNIVLEDPFIFIGVQWITKIITITPKGIKNDIGIGETNSINKQLTLRRGRVFNYKWYFEYETGILLPGNEKGKEGLTPIPIIGNPINVLTSVVLETLK